MVGRLRAFCAATAALLLGGCVFGGATPPASTINASDDNVLQPVLRGAIGFPRSNSAPSDPHSGHAVELGFTRGSGDSSESLKSNYVQFNNTRFNAPATLKYDFTLNYLDLAYRYRGLDETRSVGFEALSGLAIADLDFAVSSATQRASQNLSSPGLQLGLGLLFRMRPGTSAHLRGMYFFSGDDDGVTRATRIDAYLAQALWRHLSVRIGYTWWSLESARGEAVSPIKVDFRGPALGAELMF